MLSSRYIFGIARGDDEASMKKMLNMIKNNIKPVPLESIWEKRHGFGSVIGTSESRFPSTRFVMDEVTPDIAVAIWSDRCRELPQRLPKVFLESPTYILGVCKALHNEFPDKSNYEMLKRFLGAESKFITKLEGITEYRNDLAGKKTNMEKDYLATIKEMSKLEMNKFLNASVTKQQ